MPYKQIAPATDWYYVTLPVKPTWHVVVYPVAVWAMDDEGKVIGLISVAGGGPDDSVVGSVPRLVTPPALRGVYKIRAELSADEWQSVVESKPVNVDEPVTR